MLIWLIMAIVLVVIVAGGLGGRHRYNQQKATQGHVNPHEGHHHDHDHDHKNHRGRGKGH